MAQDLRRRLGSRRLRWLLPAASTVFVKIPTVFAFRVDHCSLLRPRRPYPAPPGASPTRPPAVLPPFASSSALRAAARARGGPDPALANDADPTPPPTTTPPPTRGRRERTNKYQDFSKVNGRVDPLEALIAESGRKNEALIAERTSSAALAKSSRGGLESSTTIAPLPKVQFPNTKGIDVSRKRAESVRKVLPCAPFFLLQYRRSLTLVR